MGVYRLETVEGGLSQSPVRELGSRVPRILEGSRVVCIKEGA